MSHRLYPGIERERMLKARATLPKEIGLALEIRWHTLRHKPIGLKHRHGAFIITSRMSQLKPLQILARQRVNILRLLLTQTFSTTLHPHSPPPHYPPIFPPPILTLLSTPL